MLTHAMFLGTASTITASFSYVLFIIMLVAFLWGTIKVIQGAANISRGDAGVMDIIGGVLIAAAPMILYNVFSGFGYTGVNLSPDTVSDFSSH